MIMFGEFFDNIEILSVKDSSGRNVFDNTDEDRTPAYMMFSLPEEDHILFRKATYLSSQYGVELILVPSSVVLEEDADVILSSDEIKEFIEDKTEMVSIDKDTNQ